MPIEIETPKPETSATETQRSVLAGVRQLGRKTGLSSQERRFIVEQLAMLLETGSTLRQALVIVGQQVENSTARQVLEDIENDISAGRTFAQALANQPDSFSSTYVSLVAASEDGGFLDHVLQQLIEMEERRDKLRSTVTSALSYPMFLTLFSIAVVIFVLAVVFPKFGTMFTAIYDQLPATTRGLMWLSDVIILHWPELVGATIALLLGGTHWARSERGKLAIDKAKLSIPGVRTVFVQLYLVQSLRVLSLSLSNGVTLVDALAACKDVVPNSLFRNLFETVGQRVQQGAGIAVGFQESEVTPTLVKQMIAAGEESGSLPKVAGRMAAYYERELTRRLELLSKMAEPIMLMVMGLVVGIIVSSLILPIFKLSRAVS